MTRRLLPFVAVVLLSCGSEPVEVRSTFPATPDPGYIVTTTAPTTTTTTAPRVHAQRVPSTTAVAANLAFVGDEVWDRIAQCESGGRWDATDGVHEGGLQFLHDTWVRAGGRRYAEHAYQATRRQQIDIANGWLARTSWSQWPVCSRRVGVR